MKKVWNELTHPMTKTAHWVRIAGIVMAIILLNERWNWFYALAISCFICQEIYYLNHRNYEKNGEKKYDK